MLLKTNYLQNKVIFVIWIRAIHVLNLSVSLFSHWRETRISLLWDEKRGSHHLSIVNLPLSSISKANKNSFLNTFEFNGSMQCQTVVCARQQKCRQIDENPDGVLIELWISVKGKWWQEQMKVKVFYGALRNARWMLRIRSQRSMREPLVNGRGVGREGGYWLCKWKRNIHLQCLIKLYHSNLLFF